MYLVYRHLPDYREEHTNPLDVVGLILFGSGVALLSYVLEVFGEHTLSTREIVGLLFLSFALLAAYGLHASKTLHPLLRLSLFRLRTFRASVVGSFVTRLGIGGIPFLFPLLYQVGMGFTPIQSGALMMPQAIAAMSLKVTMPKILARFGYRAVLVSNTLIIGAMILGFSTIGVGTPVWLIVIQLFVYGFFTSLQYTSMNTLVYAEIDEEEASAASSIASTAQQMSISFGVASRIADHRVLLAHHRARKFARLHSRRSPRLLRPRRNDRRLHHRLPQTKPRRRQRRQHPQRIPRRLIVVFANRECPSVVAPASCRRF